MNARTEEKLAHLLRDDEYLLGASNTTLTPLSTGRFFFRAVMPDTTVPDTEDVPAAVRTAMDGLAGEAKVFVFLTNRRVVFLDATFLGPGDTVISEIPREYVTAEARMGRINLSFGTRGHGVALHFREIDRVTGDELGRAFGY